MCSFFPLTDDDSSLVISIMDRSWLSFKDQFWAQINWLWYPPSARSAASPPARDADFSKMLCQALPYCWPHAKLLSNCLQAHLSYGLPYKYITALPPLKFLLKESVGCPLKPLKPIEHTPFFREKNYFKSSRRRIILLKSCLLQQCRLSFAI